MKYKGLIIAGAFTAVVATPIAITVASSTHTYTKSKYAVTFTSAAPIKTLSLFKSPTLQDIDSVTGYFNSSLTRGRPTGSENGGIETSLSLGKVIFGSQPISDISKIQETQDDGTESGISDSLTDDSVFNGSSMVLGSKTYDLAESSVAYTVNDKILGLAYKIRDKAKFWNGDRVTAEDFAKTLETILDQSNGVPFANVILKSFPIHNSQNVWDYQTSGHTFKEAVAKYPLGISYADEIPLDEMATSNDGKEYFKNEYAQGRARHKKLIMAFDSDATMFVLHYSADSVATPTSIRFFDKLGIDKYGTSIDTIMGAGPYKPVYADLDYKLVSNKWDGYWDAQHVISPQVEMRIISDESSSITLFKTGVTGQVSFGTSMLPQFMGSPELRKLVKPTNFADSVNYIPFNVNPDRPASKYLIDPDLRRAISYSINRQDYLHGIGADNSYPAESFATQQNMQDSSGLTPAAYLYRGTDYLGSPLSNKFDTIDGEEDVISRDPVVLESKDTLKNDLTDHIHNAELAKKYYARFKANHPDYNGVSLKWLFSAATTEYFLTIKQSIEETLPGVVIDLVPKPSNIVEVEKSKGDWDMSNQAWSLDYQDSWTDYHLVAEKVTKTDSTDQQTAARVSENPSSDAFSLVDYVVQKITDDPTYFKDHLNIEDEDVAQYLRMVTMINDKNPDIFTGQQYDESYWDQVPSHDNDFRGYGGEFDKWGKLLGKDTSQWGANAKAFINANVPTGSEQQLWQNEGYRNSRLYPAIEKLIRDSGLGPILKHLQNQYTASRLIGQINFTNEIVYLGYVYQTSNIPPVSIPLPGEEAVG